VGFSELQEEVEAVACGFSPIGASCRKAFSQFELTRRFEGRRELKERKEKRKKGKNRDFNKNANTKKEQVSK